MTISNDSTNDLNMRLFGQGEEYTAAFLRYPHTNSCSVTKMSLETTRKRTIRQKGNKSNQRSGTLLPQKKQRISFMNIVVKYKLAHRNFLLLDQPKKLYAGFLKVESRKYLISSHFDT